MLKFHGVIPGLVPGLGQYWYIMKKMIQLTLSRNGVFGNFSFSVMQLIG